MSAKNSRYKLLIFISKYFNYVFFSLNFSIDKRDFLEVPFNEC